MVVTLTLFVVGAVIMPSTVGLLHRCPPNDDSFSDFYTYCICIKSQLLPTVDVVCQGITTDEILSQSLIKLRNYTIDSLNIKNSGALALGSNPFRKLNIHRLIFEDVNFVVVHVFRAFAGLEYALEELHFVRCNVTFWLWGRGRQFIYLETVRFEDTRLPETLTEENIFRHFPNKIRSLQINGCSVRRLGDVALRRFPHLERLELNRNSLNAMKRSMFSPTMRRLKLISLSGNPLRSIATDIFSNMTRLEFLILSHARLNVLNNETFFPVWDQLEEIYFNNIQLNCNCNSKWMLNVPDFKIFLAPYCILHEKNLDQLSALEQHQLCFQ